MQLLASNQWHPLQLSGDTPLPLWQVGCLFMTFEAMQWCRHLHVDCFALFYGNVAAHLGRGAMLNDASMLLQPHCSNALCDAQVDWFLLASVQLVFGCVGPLAIAYIFKNDDCAIQQVHS